MNDFCQPAKTECLGDGFFGPDITHCLGCLDKLVKMTTDLAAGRDQTLAAEARVLAAEILDGLDLGSNNICEASGILQDAIRRQTGNADPFKERKQREIEVAREFVRGIAPEKIKDPKYCLRLAALGNSMDFFKDSTEALAASAYLLEQEKFFFRDDSVRLFNLLEDGPENLVFLADNAGEFVLDRPFLAHLKEKARRVVAVVKGGPCGNDLTRSDMALIPGACDSIKFADTGAFQPGVPRRENAPELYGLLDRADLIIAKGMANFETLFGAGLQCPVLFVFQVKCSPIQEMLFSTQGAFWTLWQGARSRNDSTIKAEKQNS